jgi:hypothetical protein
VGGYANTTFTDGIDKHVHGRPRTGEWALSVVYLLQRGEQRSVHRDGHRLVRWGRRLDFALPGARNQVAVDEFQPSLAAAANGTVSVAFYDRRLACPAAGTADAAAAGITLDRGNPNLSESLPPYGVSNYCGNGSIQFYKAGLSPIGHDVG